MIVLLGKEIKWAQFEKCQTIPWNKVLRHGLFIVSVCFFSVINTKLMTLVERYQNQHWWWKSIWCDSGGKSSDEIMLLKLHSLYVLVTLPSPLSLGSYSDRRPHDATCQRCHEYLGFNIVGNVWVAVSLHPNKIHNKGFIFRFGFLTS